MAYFKPVKNKLNGRWYPFAVIKGKPVSTERVARILSERCTVTQADCFAVLKDMGTVMGQLMAEGKSVRLEGLGTFRLTINSTKGGSDTEEDVKATLIEGERVRFIPETHRRSNGSVSTRAGIPDTVEWINLAEQGSTGTTEPEPPTGGGGGEDPTA